MLSIVYSSTATRPFAASDLQHLLVQSRGANEENGLTGVLVHRAGHFLQLLEGDEGSVHDLMAVIERDPRHTGLRVLLEDRVENRSFPDWTMGFVGPEQLQGDVPGLRRAFDDIDANRSSAGTLPAFRALIEWFRQEHDR